MGMRAVAENQRVASSSFAKDDSNHAVVNMDTVGYDEFIQKARRKKSEADRLQSLENEIAFLKREMRRMLTSHG